MTPCPLVLSTVLCSRDALSPDALQIASYNTRPEDKRHVPGFKAGLQRAFQVSAVGGRGGRWEGAVGSMGAVAVAGA